LYREAIMQVRRLLLATIGATVLLGSLVGSASARTLSLENASATFRVVFRTVTFNGIFGDIRCAVTVEGSVHARTLAKVTTNLIGYITSAILGTCAEGTATILRETLPWHVHYSGFTSTLPNITSIRLAADGVSFRMREPFATCLATSTHERPAIGTFGRSVSTRKVTEAELSGRVPTNCGSEGTLSSTKDRVVDGNGAELTVTLI
jgi:hypothetical protein